MRDRVPSIWSSAHLVPLENGAKRVSLCRAVTLLGAGQQEKTDPTTGHVLVLNCHGELHMRDVTGRAAMEVNGKRMDEAEVRNGDVVRFGRVEYRVAVKHPDENPRRRERRGRARLRCNGDQLEIVKPITIIGTDARADLRIAERGLVAGRAAVVNLDGEFWAWELASQMELQVNGEAKKCAALAENMPIKLGEAVVHFERPAPEIEMKKAVAAGPRRIEGWGPLAGALLAAHATEVPGMNAAPVEPAEQVEGAGEGGRSGRWMIALVIAGLVIGGAVYAWMHFGSRLWAGS